MPVAEFDWGNGSSHGSDDHDQLSTVPKSLLQHQYDYATDPKSVVKGTQLKIFDGQGSDF